MQLRDKLKTTVKDSSEKLKKILLESGVEAVTTKIYSFNDFDMYNCVIFNAKKLCVTFERD